MSQGDEGEFSSIFLFLKATSWLRSVLEVVLCLADLTTIFQECTFDLELK